MALLRGGFRTEGPTEAHTRHLSLTLLCWFKTSPGSDLPEKGAIITHPRDPSLLPRISSLWPCDRGPWIEELSATRAHLLAAV